MSDADDTQPDLDVISVTMLVQVREPLRAWLATHGLALCPLPEGDPDQYIVVPTQATDTLGGEPRSDHLWPNGLHEYWSTHCRHDRHEQCSAAELAPGVPRMPAQCKTCGAGCRCACHHPIAEPVTERRLALVPDPVGRSGA